MINLLLIVPILASFLIVVFMLPHWIKRTKEVGLIGKDMNKYSKPEVSEAGGLCVVAGFILGVLIYIAIKTFYFKTETNIINIFAILSTVIIVAVIGLIDDIFGWKIGLSKRTRLFWVLIASIPLIVINAGSSVVNIPFLGRFDLWLVYPIIIVPLGIIGASTTFNFLAGYNGLEAGMGMLVLGALGVVSYMQGETWVTLICFCMIASLFGFLLFNKYPAKIFPGDVLTYSVGAMIASVAILGNMEKFALFIFLPYFIEIILKIRGKLKIESFANPNEDGSIELKHKKFYGLEHVMLSCIKKIKKSKKAFEYEVVIGIWILEIIIILIGFFLLNKGLFN